MTHHSDAHMVDDYEEYDAQTTDVPHPADIAYFYDNDANLAYDDDEFTPQDLIISAAKRHDANGIKRVLETGVCIDVIEWGWAPLHWVSTNYDESSKSVPDYIIKATELLIEMGANLDVRGDMNETPLHHVANIGLVETTTVLLQKGATIDVVDKFGWTPLHYAAANGKMGTARLLVLYGANLNSSIASAFYNGEYAESSPASLALKHKKHDTLPEQLQKCTKGMFTYENWVKSKRSKFITLLEKTMRNIPSEVCGNFVDYWIDISREAWLDKVWPLSVKE